MRATKSAASLMDKNSKKKKSTLKQSVASKGSDDKGGSVEPSTVSSSPPPVTETGKSTKNTSENKGTNEKQAVVSPAGASDASKSPNKNINSSTKSRAESPPSLPKLNQEGSITTRNGSKTNGSTGSDTSPKAPPSPEQTQFRKRRRMRSVDGGSEPTTGTCGVTDPFQGDKLFPDFCPPRADLARAGSPPPRLSSDDVPHMNMCGMTPIGRSSSKFADDDDIRCEDDSPGVTSAGCAGIALDMMTGAAAGSFCLGPRLWSKRE